jgi:hypothetical protein
MLNETTGVMDKVYIGNITVTDKTTNGTIFACGNIKSFAPAAELLYLLLLSQSLPVLLFGMVFAVPALKQLQTSLKKLSSRVGASSANSSSSDK